MMFKKLPSYDSSDCPVCTVQMDGFSPDKIINTIDYSDMIYSNSHNYHKSVVLSKKDEANQYKISYYEVDENYYNDYLITNFVSNNNKPLYYSYELKFDAFGVTASDIITIYKNNEQIVPASDYIIQFADITFTDNYYNDNNNPAYLRYSNNIEWTNNFNNQEDIHRVRVLLPIDFHNVNDFYTIRYNKHLYNVNFPIHTELIELNVLYKFGSDFDIIEDSDDKLSIIHIPESSSFPSDVPEIYIIKDPESIINPLGSFSLDKQGPQTDNISSWNLRVNGGKFIMPSDYKGENINSFNLQYVDYSSEQTQEDRFQPLTYVVPDLLAANILKVDQTPIYINDDDYLYPDYNITVYHSKTVDIDDIPSGSIGIDVDNVMINDIDISSIDRNKGYILTNKTFTVNDNINLFYYTDMNSNIFIRNLELNPKLQKNYGFNSDSEKKLFNTIGIVLRKLPESLEDLTTPEEKSKYYYPWFFEFDEDLTDNQFTFYRATTYPSITTADSMLGKLIHNPYSSDGVGEDGEFLLLAILSVNKLTPDTLTITDARKFGGGINPKNIDRLDANQKNSYTDVGFYDGEPVPHGGTIIIHIPQKIVENLISRWENSNMFGPSLYTDISSTEIQEILNNLEGGEENEFYEYYNNLLQGRNNKGDPAKEDFLRMRSKWAKKQASHYLDQIIKKYIPAGTQYILLNENYKEINLDV